MYAPFRKERVQRYLGASEGEEKVRAVFQRFCQLLSRFAAAAVEAADMLQGFPRHPGKGVGRHKAECVLAVGKLSRGPESHVGKLTGIPLEVAGGGIMLKKEYMHELPLEHGSAHGGRVSCGGRPACCRRGRASEY